MEEVQGSATSSLFTPPHIQNTWPCVQLLCAERNAPCQRDLAIDKAEPPASAAKWQGNDQICNVRLQDIATTRSNELLVRLGILILKERRLRWYGHVERSNGAVKTAFDIQVDGKRGPKWHGSSWQRGIAESGSSQLSTPMIDIPGDLVWDLPWVQQATIWKGAHWCGCCPCTCTLIKNLIMIMIYIMNGHGSHLDLYTRTYNPLLTKDSTWSWNWQGILAEKLPKLVAFRTKRQMTRLHFNPKNVIQNCSRKHLKAHKSSFKDHLRTVEKKRFDIHARCLLRRQFAWNVNLYFLGK